MILITGGAYQGKLEYALTEYKLTLDDVFNCTNTDNEQVFNKRIIYGAEKWILSLIQKGQDPLEILEEMIPKWKDKIIICNDISCGVVPIDPLMRKWREAVGRCMTLCAKHSETVVRVFCGIGTKIK